MRNCLQGQISDEYMQPVKLVLCNDGVVASGNLDVTIRITPNDNVYKHYGGRGISYATEWEHFEPFYKWAIENGYRFDGKRGDCTLDRIDVNGNYSPENCRWIPASLQQDNKRNRRHITVDGNDYTLAELEKETGIKADTIAARIDRYGYTAKEAVTEETRARHRKFIEYNGQSHTAKEWSEMLGLSKNAVAERIKRGWTIERALTAKNAVDFFGR